VQWVFPQDPLLGRARGDEVAQGSRRTGLMVPGHLSSARTRSGIQKCLARQRSTAL